MSKRFTETRIWDDPWYQDLPLKYKLLWKYVCDKCGLSGAWPVNLRLATFQLGESFDEKEALRLFNSGKERVKNYHGIWLVLEFVSFQYGVLHPEKIRFHKTIIEEIDRLSHRLLDTRQEGEGEEDAEGEEVGEEVGDKEGEGGKETIDCGKYTEQVKAVIACRPEFGRLQPDAIAKELIDAESNPRLAVNLGEFLRDAANSIEPPRNPIGMLRAFLASDGMHGKGIRKEGFLKGR